LKLLSIPKDFYTHSHSKIEFKKKNYLKNHILASTFMHSICIKKNKKNKKLFIYKQLYVFNNLIAFHFLPYNMYIVFQSSNVGASLTSYKWASKYQVPFSLKDYLLIFYIINLCEYLKNKCLHTCERLGKK